MPSALLVYVVSIDLSFCTRSICLDAYKHVIKQLLTEISKPMSRTSFFTSSRSSSIDGSLVVLFSKCHRRGPGGIIHIHPRNLSVDRILHDLGVKWSHQD